MKKCEAIGCDAKATAKVKARIGDKRSIILFLCNDCKPKFTDCREGDQRA